MKLKRLGKSVGEVKLSLVKYPAIQENFIALSDDSDVFTIALAEEKGDQRIITGPALVPNKWMERVKSNCHLYATPSDVRDFAHKFLQYSLYNTEHSEDTTALRPLESWISRIDNELGFNVPKGTWFMSLSVEDDELWKDIKTGKYRGFSIEGYFINSLNN